jgi:hypothetical protein
MISSPISHEFVKADVSSLYSAVICSFRARAADMRPDTLRDLLGSSHGGCEIYTR